ncbi:hypothetical protein V2O64_10675 [Verrucomicrobiaceae bacterium 227]
MRKLFPLVCLLAWSCQEKAVTEAEVDPPTQVTTEGVITTIDNDWGFLIVKLEGGAALKVQDSRFLKSRSGEVHGEILISALEEDQAIVEPISGSTSFGMSLRPGDLVVLAP